MFRDFNTLELTFCVEFIIILSQVPPTLLSILSPAKSSSESYLMTKVSPFLTSIGKVSPTSPHD